MKYDKTPHKLVDIFPDFKEKVKRLKVVKLDENETNMFLWIWIRALQGLINKEEPHIYVIQHANSFGKRQVYEDHWLEYYKEKYDFPIEYIDDPEILLDEYRHVYDGYVLYDFDDVRQTQNLAITMAGLKNALPINADQEDIMIKHGIKKIDDLRGRFEDDWAAAEWAVENLWEECNKRIIANMCIHLPNNFARSQDIVDYIVYNKVFAMDLPRNRSHRKMLNLARHILDTADAPGVQISWHCSLDQEKEYVAEAAERGFFSLCSTNTPNLTIHGGVGDIDKSFEPAVPDPEKCVAKKGEVYVCLYNSDGDATWAVNNLNSGNWLAPRRGAFSFGWGFLPLSIKMMPAMMEYYHETKTPNDCFWGPSSGAGYTYSFMWPEGLAEQYLLESRDLLKQTGHNGCNMVNWFLRDWWREVEDEEAVNREREILKDFPGLVCGLGGSPYAKSYIDDKGIPKLHSVHIANVGKDNIKDVIQFAKECPTRPLFMFMFAQISRGIFEQLESEMELLDDHPEIKILRIDEFFHTLQDAVKKGMLKDELYEKTDALAERWLKNPGKHRLPLYERLMQELDFVANTDSKTRCEHIGRAGWTELVSKEIENVAMDREEFLNAFENRAVMHDYEEADALFYTAFTVVWGLIRSCLESQGIYANHKDQCLNDFKKIASDLVDMTKYEDMFIAWDKWEEGSPSVETLGKWCSEMYADSKVLLDAFGPEEEEEFTGWPPRTI